jgi:iron complex transport system permease protein
MNRIHARTRRHRMLGLALLVALVVMSTLSLFIGSQGLEWPDFSSTQTQAHTPTHTPTNTPPSPGAFADAAQAALILDIRLPRTLGVVALGLLLGLGGALAQGLFRNPLADPYLLGSGSGAALAVTLVAAASAGATAAWQPLEPLVRAGVMGAAFVGALGGALLTLLLARGAQHTHRLLLAGLVVGVVLGALTDLVSTFVPDAWRQRQSLLLGNTQLLNNAAVAALWAMALLGLAFSLALARVLDVLTLGEEAAASLGLPVAPMRLLLVGVMAACTAVAVSQAGLILFVALVAPHLVRHLAPSGHGFLLPASAGMGAVVLLAADIGARWALAPQELPVGVVTGVGGGVYLLALLHRRQPR